jgi:hypothetical protein
MVRSFPTSVGFSFSAVWFLLAAVPLLECSGHLHSILSSCVCLFFRPHRQCDSREEEQNGGDTLGMGVIQMTGPRRLRQPARREERTEHAVANLVYKWQIKSDQLSRDTVAPQHVRIHGKPRPVNNGRRRMMPVGPSCVRSWAPTVVFLCESAREFSLLLPPSPPILCFVSCPL